MAHGIYRNPWPTCIALLRHRNTMQKPWESPIQMAVRYLALKLFRLPATPTICKTSDNHRTRLLILAGQVSVILLLALLGTRSSRLWVQKRAHSLPLQKKPAKLKFSKLLLSSVHMKRRRHHRGQDLPVNKKRRKGIWFVERLTRKEVAESRIVRGRMFVWHAVGRAMLSFNVVTKVAKKGCDGGENSAWESAFPLRRWCFRFTELVLEMCGESIRHGRIDVRGGERQNWRALKAGLRGFLLASALGFHVSRYSRRRSI